MNKLETRRRPHTQFESQASQVSLLVLLNFTLESLASQDFAVNNTSQPTSPHFFINQISSIPQLPSSTRIISPSERRKNAAAHGRRTARRFLRATRIPGRSLGLTSFPTPFHHLSVTHYLHTHISFLDICLCFSQQREWSLSHHPPSHSLHFAFASPFTLHTTRQQHTSHQLINSSSLASLASSPYAYSRKPLADSLASRAYKKKASSGVLPRRVSPAPSDLSDRVCTQRACARHTVSAESICARLVPPNAPRVDRGRKQQTSNTQRASLPPRAHHPTTSRPASRAW
jgi:hypothetical protein